MFKIFFLIIVVLMLNACQQCKPTTEPSIFITFTKSLSYSTFRTINDTTNYPIKNNIFPLAINQDTSRIILKNKSQEDTLIISYNRSFKYEKSNCGYEITLDNLRITPTKTFKNGFFSLNNNSKISASYALNLDN